MMGWLKALVFWGEGDAPPSDAVLKSKAPVTHQELEATKREYDRRLMELQEAVYALRGEEPDRWERREDQPHA